MAVHISPERIQRLRGRWEREVLVGLQRQDRRLTLLRELPVPPKEERPRSPIARTPPRLLPARLVRRTDAQFHLLRTIGWRLRALRGASTRQLLPLGRRAARWERSPERAARHAMFRLASRVLPRGLRQVIEVLRALQRLDGRYR